MMRLAYSGQGKPLLSMKRPERQVANDRFRSLRRTPERTFLDIFSKVFDMADMDRLKLTIMSPLDFGRAFRAERRALGKTQQEVADVAECRRQTIADLEAGRNVTLYTAMKALQVLSKGVRIADVRPEFECLHLLADPEDDD